MKGLSLKPGRSPNIALCASSTARNFVPSNLYLLGPFIFFFFFLFSSPSSYGEKTKQKTTTNKTTTWTTNNNNKQNSNTTVEGGGRRKVNDWRAHLLPTPPSHPPAIIPPTVFLSCFHLDFVSVGLTGVFRRLELVLLINCVSFGHCSFPCWPAE